MKRELIDYRPLEDGRIAFLQADLEVVQALPPILAELLMHHAPPRSPPACIGVLAPRDTCAFRRRYESVQRGSSRYNREGRIGVELLRLYWLGYPRIELDGTSVKLETWKRTALLAYTSLCERPVSRGRTSDRTAWHPR